MISYNISSYVISFYDGMIPYDMSNVTTCASRPPSLDVSLSRSQGSDVEFAGESPSIANRNSPLRPRGPIFWTLPNIGGLIFGTGDGDDGRGTTFFLVGFLFVFWSELKEMPTKRDEDASLFTGSGLIFSAFQHLQRGSHVTSVMLSRLRGVTYPLFSKEKGPKLRWYSFLYKQTSLSYSKRLPWKIRVNYIELQDCNF